jgi:hypothetical protein
LQAPCKDCPDRRYLCHSTCEKYIKYNEYREMIRKKKREFYSQEYDYMESVMKGRRK